MKRRSFESDFRKERKQPSALHVFFDDGMRRERHAETARGCLHEQKELFIEGAAECFAGRYRRTVEPVLPGLRQARIVQQPRLQQIGGGTQGIQFGSVRPLRSNSFCPR